MFVIILSLIACTLVASTPVEVEPPVDGRIVGGIATNIRSFPWQVSLQYKGKHMCGGSIYNRKIIVTAAHCVHDLKASDITVRVGSSYWNHGGKLYAVAKTKIPKDYDTISHNNDIAVIRLKKSLTLSSSVQPIQLARRAPKDGVSATVSGWGHTSYRGDNSEQLRSVTVKMISEKNCASSKYGYGSRIKSTMICASAPGKDACQNDSGGPLIANGALVGIVSWGDGCAESRHPGVYVDVAQLGKWVEKAAKSI